ncbi:MAG: glycosyltransferase [Patescibacteria group bacterium]
MKPDFVLITHDYPPQKGGVARYLSSLVKASSGSIAVWLPTEFAPITDVSTSDVRRVDFWWSHWPKWLPLVRRCLEVPDDKIILVSHVFPIGTAAWIANALGGAEYAVIFHGTDLKRANTRWKRRLLRQICNNAQLLIVNSQAVGGLLTKLAPKAKPVVLTPGLEPFNLPSKSAARQNLGIAPQTKIILTVSRLVERKGIDTLVRAVSSLEHGTWSMEHGSESEFGLPPEAARPSEPPDPRSLGVVGWRSGLAKGGVQNSGFTLVVIGDGPEREKLQSLAKEQNINVRWVNDADDQVLYSWYAAADIFCLPGRETADDIEGFGMVFLEAAYAKLPVIAGQSGGASEAVLHNQTGLLIEPTVESCAGALQDLLNNPDKAAKLGAAGHDRVIKDFQWAERWNKLKNSEHRTQNTDQSSEFGIHNSASDVSVVIPCYNHAEELGSTLESLVNQTINVKEVIVVDDASTDDMEPVINLFKEKLPIDLIRHEQNRGAAAARNTGLRSAAGEFIIFLDADIVLEPTAIAKMHQVLQNNPNASFAFSDFYWGRIHFKGQPFNVVNLQKINYIHTSSLIRQRDMVEFDESLKKFQDWDLWLSLAEKGKVGIWIPEILFKVAERKLGMSKWLPSFMHKINWPILGYTPKEILRYREAEKIVKDKHKLKANSQ